MAAKNAAAQKKMASGFSNERQFMKLTYDFANDGGATTDTYRLAQVDDKILISEAIVQVETACTSGGAATVTIGAETADPDAMLAAQAVAGLTDDATFEVAAGQKLVVGSGDWITMSIGTAALTAGKINVYVSYYNAA